MTAKRLIRITTNSMLAGALLIALGACQGEPSKQFSIRNTYSNISCSNSRWPMVNVHARGGGTGFNKPSERAHHQEHNLTPYEAMELCNAFLSESANDDLATPSSDSMD